MFDHTYCQNIHFQSQNRCFNEFTHFRQNTCHKASVCFCFTKSPDQSTLDHKSPFSSSYTHSMKLLSIILFCVFQMPEMIWSLYLCFAEFSYADFMPLLNYSSSLTSSSSQSSLDPKSPFTFPGVTLFIPLLFSSKWFRLSHCGNVAHKMGMAWQNVM